MIDSLKDRWETITPKGKRYLVISAIVIVFTTIMMITDSGPRNQNRVKSEPVSITNILTDSDPRELGIDALSSQVRRLMAENDQLKETFTTMEANVERNQQRAVKNMVKDYNDAVAKIEMLNAEVSDVQALKAELAAMKAEIAKGASVQQVAPAPSNLNPSDSQQNERTSPDSPEIIKEDLKPRNLTEQKALDAFSGTPSSVESFARSTLGTAEDNADKRDISSIRVISSETNPVAGSKKEEEEKPERTIMLPAGTILSGILINGMDAPTGTNTKADPYPSLIRIKHEAVLPNYYRSDVRECMMIGATHGSLSDERAYTRLETITCIFNDNSVAEKSIDGYAVGEDGKLGMRGRLVSKNGVILARALTAGFLEGISSAFAGARVPVVSGNVTQSQQVQSLLTGSSISAAGLEGAGSAMEKLADYFIELAAGIYPVIEIDAGRNIEFVITKGTSLKME